MFTYLGSYGLRKLMFVQKLIRIPIQIERNYDRIESMADTDGERWN